MGTARNMMMRVMKPMRRTTPLSQRGDVKTHTSIHSNTHKGDSQAGVQS